MLSGTAFIYHSSISETDGLMTLFAKTPDNTALTLTIPIQPMPDDPPTPYRKSDLWVSHCPGTMIQWQTDRIDGATIHKPILTPINDRWTPTLSTASLDIETSCFGNKLYCIGVHFSGQSGEQSKVFMLARETKPDPKIDYFTSEATLLTEFCTWFKSLSPDILVGWHIHEFDIKFIAQRCSENNIPFDIGPRTLVLDADECITALGIPLNGLSLEAVSQQYLGEGKLIRPDADKVYEIERMYRHDPHALGLYNLKDCELVTRILQKLHIMPALIELSIRLNCPITWLLSKKKALDIAYTKALLASESAITATTETVTDPPHFRVKAAPGPHTNITEFDISHLTAVAARLTGIDPLHVATNGQTSLLPHLTEPVSTELDSAIQYYLHHEFEVLTQSTTHRLFSPEIHWRLRTAATTLLRVIVTTLRDHYVKPILNHDGRLIVTSPTILDNAAVTQLSNKITQRLTKEYPTTRHYTLKILTQYEHAFIPPHRYWKAHKTPHYFKGTITNNAIIVSGNDWNLQKPPQPHLLAIAAQGVFETLFKNQPILPWVEHILDQLESGQLDHTLSVTKRIKKSPRRYGLAAPPHIIAARIAKKMGGKIEYLMTRSGPHPTSVTPYSIDYQYYIDTIIKPLLAVVSDHTNVDPKLIGVDRRHQ